VPQDVYLIRHGATEWTHSGQHTGRTDLPLLPEGEAQAGALAPHLRRVGFTAAFTSDLRRARRTAELLGLPNLRVTPQLREFDYGDYEGLTSEEIWRLRPDWRIYRDGCPGGESPAQVYRRARSFLEGLAGMETPLAVVSHGHFLRALAVAWVGLDIQAAADLELDTAAVCVLRDGDRGRVVQRWNWTPDLV
jgi:broad specificity phosphatase PhoE